MILELKEANKLPMKTFRWLGVNELKILREIPDLKPFQGIEAEGTETNELVITRNNTFPYEKMPLTGMGEEAAEFIHQNKNQEMTITVPKGKKVTEPVFIRYSLTREYPVLAEEICILAEEDSEITLVVVYEGEEEANAFHGGLFYLKAAKNSVINLVQVQLLPDTAFHFGNIGAEAAENGRIRITQCELGGGYAISGILGELKGDGSGLNVDTIYFGDRERSLDFNYVANHYGRDSKSDMKVNGALSGTSKKIFRGTIDFKKGASGSEGAEGEYTLLFDKNIKNVSVPLILCGEENVSGKHAANSGRLEEEKLFYMMSRGLSEKEAKKMMLEAWFHPAVQNIPSEEIRERVSEYVNRRLNHVKSL